MTDTLKLTDDQIRDMAHLTGIYTLLQDGHRVRVIAKQLGRRTDDVVREIYQSGWQHMIRPDDTVMQPDVFDRIMAGEKLMVLAAELGCAESQVCRKFKATGAERPRRCTALNRLRLDNVPIGVIGKEVERMDPEEGERLVTDYLRSRKPSLAAFLVDTWRGGE